MTHFWTPFFTKVPFFRQEMFIKVTQKWVIFRIPRARARARARGDKTGFVLETPINRPCMESPKMGHFDPFFDPLFSRYDTEANLTVIKSDTKVGHFRDPGIPGSIPFLISFIGPIPI